MGGFSFLATDTKNSGTFYVFHLRINPSLIFHMLLRVLYIALKAGGASLPSIVKQMLLSIWRRDCYSRDFLNFYHFAY